MVNTKNNLVVSASFDGLMTMDAAFVWMGRTDWGPGHALMSWQLHFGFNLRICALNSNAKYGIDAFIFTFTMHWLQWKKNEPEVDAFLKLGSTDDNFQGFSVSFLKHKDH